MRSFSLLGVTRGVLRSVVLLGILAGVASRATAQPRRLSLDDLHDPSGRVSSSDATPPSIAWIDATHYVTSRRMGTHVHVAWPLHDRRASRRVAVTDGCGIVSLDFREGVTRRGVLWPLHPSVAREFR